MGFRWIAEVTVGQSQSTTMLVVWGSVLIFPTSSWLQLAQNAAGMSESECWVIFFFLPLYAKNNYYRALPTVGRRPLSFVRRHFFLFSSFYPWVLMLQGTNTILGLSQTVVAKTGHVWSKANRRCTFIGRRKTYFPTEEVWKIEPLKKFWGLYASLQMWTCTKKFQHFWQWVRLTSSTVLVGDFYFLHHHLACTRLLIHSKLIIVTITYCLEDSNK